MPRVGRTRRKSSRRIRYLNSHGDGEVICSQGKRDARAENARCQPPYGKTAWSSQRPSSPHGSARSSLCTPRHSRELRNDCARRELLPDPHVAGFHERENRHSGRSRNLAVFAKSKMCFNGRCLSGRRTFRFVRRVKARRADGWVTVSVKPTGKPVAVTRERETWIARPTA